MLQRYVYSANIATLSCSRSKRNAAAAEVEGEAVAAAAGRAVWRPCGPGAGRWAVLGGA